MGCKRRALATCLFAARKNEFFLERAVAQARLHLGRLPLLVHADPLTLRRSLKDQQ